jgi:hypothetical protein
VVERFAIAGFLEEYPDDAASRTVIFASGAGRIERGQCVAPIAVAALRFCAARF